MRTSVGRPFAALLWPVLLVLSLAGCASFSPPYDQASRDRVTAISEQVLGLYQALLSTPPDRRRAEAAALQPRFDEIETAVRVHILLERARPDNEASVFQAEILLRKLAEYRARYLGGNPEFLSSAVVAIDRTTLEDILVAMLAGEDAKKLAEVAGEG